MRSCVWGVRLDVSKDTDFEKKQCACWGRRKGERIGGARRVNGRWFTGYERPQDPPRHGLACPDGGNTAFDDRDKRVNQSVLATGDPMIAVRPPEYFPRLKHMALLQHVDHFILADTFPHRQQSFQNRSKLRSPQGWHWITVPVFGNRDGAPICDVEIKTGGRWREKHWRSFLYNYRTTMYFEFFEASFRPFFERVWERLSPCTCRSVTLLAELFGLRTTVTRASELDGAPGSLAEVVQATDADTLVVPETDVSPSAALPSDVSVQTFAYEHPTYRQNFESFEAGMSAADLVFNYGPEARRILADGVVTTSFERHPR